MPIPKSTPQTANVKFSRPPQPRNQQIWRAVRVGGRTQDDVAGEHHLSQNRISKIVRQVDRWVAFAQPHTAGNWPADQQQSFTNQVAKLMLDEQLKTAVASFAKSQQATVTVKERAIVDCGTEKTGPTETEVLVRKIREKIEKTVPQGDVRFLEQQRKLVLSMRDIDFDHSLIPVPSQRVTSVPAALKPTPQTRLDQTPQMSRALYLRQQSEQGSSEKGSGVYGGGGPNLVEESSSAKDSRPPDVRPPDVVPQIGTSLTKTYVAAEEIARNCFETAKDICNASCEPMTSKALTTSASQPTPPLGPFWNSPQNDALKTPSAERKSREQGPSAMRSGIYDGGGSDLVKESSSPKDFRPPDVRPAGSPARKPNRGISKGSQWTFYDRNGNVTDVCPWGG